MKLLHLTNLYPPFSSGTAEKQCRAFVHELAARNHVCRVLTSNVTQNDVPDRDPHVMRKLRLSPSGGTLSLLRLLVDQHFNRKILVDELESLAPDLVVVWSLAGLSNALLWEIERRGFRLFFAILDAWPRHRLRDDSWYRWWFGPLRLPQKILRRMLRQTHLDRRIRRTHPARRPNAFPLRHCCFASRALRDSIELAGYAVEHSEIIPYCLGRDELPPPAQVRDEMRRLLWIGRLDADHDPMTAVQALQELRHQGEMRFALDLFGRGDVAVEGRVRDYIRNAQLAGTVTIRHASLDDLQMLFPTYDILVHTARHPEPFPLAILRAMAARLPVIATPEGSVGDLVRNGQNALTFRCGDPPDCAEKILRLVSERSLRSRLVESAYRDVLDNYSAPTVTGRLEQLLREAATARPA